MRLAAGSDCPLLPTRPSLQLLTSNQPNPARRRAAVALSVDHKPNTKEERDRIEAAGGVVVWAGTWRVSGVLAVSRAFGDRPLKRYVIPTPDVHEETLTQHGERAAAAAAVGLLAA
jgi:hypothetical protein